MGITSFQGPFYVPGADKLDYNESPGASSFAHGVGIVDTRFNPGNGADVTAVRPIWFGADAVIVLDQAPSTLSATNIAAAQVPVAATPVTLAGASTGITVLAAPLSIIAGQVFPTGTLIIDGNPALITLAPLGGGVSMYDSRTMVARRLIFTSVGDDHLATVAIVGVDMYGYTIHETVTLSNATTVNSLKCYKGVISITPAGTLSGSNLSVGTTDIYEFPLAAWEFQFVQIYWNATLISATTGYTAPVTTTATATTGDVRGVYGTQSASDGTKKLQIVVKPLPWNLVANGVNSLFGVLQF